MSAEASPASANGKAIRLFNRNFTLLWSGQFVSQLGNSAHAIAALYYVKEATGAPIAVGFLLFLGAITGILFGPLAGALADKGDKRWILIASDLVSAGATLGLALLVFVLPREMAGVGVVAVIGVAFITNASGTFFGPAMGSLLPTIVPDDALRKANSLYRMGARVTELLGNLLGGVIFAIIGAVQLFLFNALSYGVGALLTWKAVVPRPMMPAGGRDQTLGMRRLLKDFVAVFQELRTVPGAARVFLMAMGINLMAAPIFVLLPFHVEDAMGGGAAHYGILMATMIAGSLGGYAIAGLGRLPSWARGGSVAAAVCIMCASFIGVGTSTTLVQGACWMLLAGLSHGYWSILFETALQKEIRREFLGRTFAAFGLVGRSMMPVGYLVGGIMGEALRAHVSAAIVGLSMVLAAVPLLFALDSAFRSFFRDV